MQNTMRRGDGSDTTERCACGKPPHVTAIVTSPGGKPGRAPVPLCEADAIRADDLGRLVTGSARRVLA